MDLPGMPHDVDTIPHSPASDSDLWPSGPKLGPGSRLVGRSRSTATDPMEPWEIPVLKRDRYKIDRSLPGRPFRPSQTQDVPEPALATLVAVCGPLELARLFVVPRTTRLIDPTHCVITPAKVVGFGESVVAVWVDDGPEGRMLSLPIARLTAIEDRTILLYGRLRLIAADKQLVIRYNTVSRDDLRQDICWLRRRTATKVLPSESGFLWLDSHNRELPQSALPHKWRVVLDFPTVRPDPDEHAMIAVGDLAEISRGRRRQPSGLAVLGSRELVIANEPSEYLGADRYGVDLLAVPRERLDSLGWDGRSLTVHFAEDRPGADGPSSVISPLEASLVEAMRRAFGSAVRWC